MSERLLRLGLAIVLNGSGSNQTRLLGLEHAQELRATVLLARAAARSRVKLGATQGRWQVISAAADDVLLPGDVDIDAGSVTGDAWCAIDVRRLVHDREVPLRALLLLVLVVLLVDGVLFSAGRPRDG